MLLPELSDPVGDPPVVNILLITQLELLQSMTSNWPGPGPPKLVNCKSNRSGPFAGLYGNGVVNAIVLVNGHGPGPAHPAPLMAKLLAENTSVLSAPILFANVVLNSVCPVEFAQVRLVDRYMFPVTLRLSAPKPGAARNATPVM